MTCCSPPTSRRPASKTDAKRQLVMASRSVDARHTRAVSALACELRHISYSRMMRPLRDAGRVHSLPAPTLEAKRGR